MTQNTENATLLGLSYKVKKHEHIDDKFAAVELRCIGYPTEGTQPDEWAFGIKVPLADLDLWPLGKLVRMEIR